MTTAPGDLEALCHRGLAHVVASILMERSMGQRSLWRRELCYMRPLWILRIPLSGSGQETRAISPS